MPAKKVLKGQHTEVGPLTLRFLLTQNSEELKENVKKGPCPYLTYVAVAHHLNESQILQ